MSKRKGKPRPWVWVVLGLVAALIVLVVVVIRNLPMPQQQQVSDSSFNLSSIEDGTYPGECDNGLVVVRLEVTVRDHAMAGVHIIEHQNGKGQSAEAITDKVVASQSVEVDAVAGATISSQTILKAIENALSAQGGK